ncbi:MFS transporter [Brevibacterium daeguense]|uniref:MFS transporter n=1 Tax=Brevibacterium daeguense TaxID=909936 RepID=A0ABP8EHG6_9MICO|nr:MFS transporter [Brevibacterium daeguense]
MSATPRPSPASGESREARESDSTTAPGSDPATASAPAAAAHESAGASGAPKRTIVSWALWDWGSAAFNAVIVTFVFAPYLTSGVAADSAGGSSALGLVTGIAGLIIAILAPATGIRADRGGRHRLWLGVNSGLVVACMLGMFFIKDSPEFLWPGLLLLGLANVFFELAEVFYNGMLTRISTPTTAGRISGLGWGLGYFGGLVLLMLLLVTVIQPEVGLFGATDEDGLRYRVVAVAAAVWFGVFAIPILIFAPREAVSPAEARERESMFSFVTRWAADFRHLIRRIVALFKTDRETLKFLAASAVFRDGLATIFAFAGVIAAGSYGFDGSEIILLGVAANLVAGVGALSAGWFDDRFGAKTVIVVGLVCLIAGAVPIIVSGDKTVFWIAAMWLCLFVGPVQSASRPFLTRITPPERAGENFGLYATTGRAVSFLGPLLFAAFIALFGFQRAGAIGIMLVLAAGLVLMLFVRGGAALRENVEHVRG